MEAIKLTLNRDEIRLEPRDGETLLAHLRGRARLPGTKHGCGEGICGSCLVLLARRREGRARYRAVPACLLPLDRLDGCHVVTIEGLSGKALTPIQSSLIRHGAVQCGFCSPGLVIALTAFCLDEDGARASVHEAIDGNLCRCTGYKAIERAAHALASELPQRESGERLAALVAAGWLPAWFAEIAGEKHMRASAGEHEGVQLLAGKIVIEAETPLTDLCRAAIITTHAPALAEVITRELPLHLRNFYSLGDLLTAPDGGGAVSALLLVLGAVIERERDGRSSACQLTRYLEDTPCSTETVVRISFPQPEQDDHLHLESIAHRAPPDRAQLATAVLLRLRDGRIRHAALAVSGVERRPCLLRRSGDLLPGRSVSPETLESLLAEARAEIAPNEDANGSALFKQLMVKELLIAHFRQLIPRIHEAPR